MNLENVKQEDWIVAGLALLLAIALLFFPWYHVSASFAGVTISRSASATSSPYAIWGVLALITSLAIVADIALERLSPQTQIPSLSGSRTMTRLAIVGVTIVLLVIKFLAHIGSFGWGFFVTIVITGALAYFAYMEHNAAPVVGSSAAAPPPPPPPAPPAGTAGTTGTPGGTTPPAGGSTPPPPGP